jgi:hypothetical protein
MMARLDVAQAANGKAKGERSRPTIFIVPVGSIFCAPSEMTNSKPQSWPPQEASRQRLIAQDRLKRTVKEVKKEV